LNRTNHTVQIYLLIIRPKVFVFNTNDKHKNSAFNYTYEIAIFLFSELLAFRKIIIIIIIIIISLHRNVIKQEAKKIPEYIKM
jgi:hypothetical protein